jgi:curli production assembly/transport component CsgE
MKKMLSSVFSISTRHLCCALFIAAALNASVAFSASACEPSREAASEDCAQRSLYGGLVTNQTITVAGQDFYRYFVASWQELAISGRFAISIHERPSARWGSQIWIEFAQRRIVQMALPAGRSGIRAISEQAAAVVQQRIIDAELERTLFRNADLGADEI